MSKDETQKKNFQTSNVLIITIGHFVHDVYTSFIAPIVKELIQKLDINLTLIAVLQVIQRIPALLNPFIGIMAENLRMRYFVILAPAITATCMSLIGVAPNFTILAIFLFAAGLSSSLFHVPTPVMIKKVSGKYTGRGMSFYMIGGELARSIGPLIIAAVVTKWGLEGTWKVFPFGVFTSIFLFFRLRHIEIRRDLSQQEITISYGQTFIKYLPVFIVLGGITVFRGAMKSALTLYLPTYLRDNGASLWTASISLAVLQLSGALGTFLSGTLSDKLGRRNTLTIITIMAPLLFLLFLYVENSGSMILLFFIGLFLFAHQSVMLAVIHDIKSDKMAFLNGIYMTTNFFLNAVMLLLTGFMADKLGLETTFKIAAFIGFLCVPFALRLKN